MLQKDYEIGRELSCETLFEISVSYNGSSYLVIYGKHVNGYFCCLPGEECGCEMAEPNDLFYNVRSLAKACLHFGLEEATAIARAIQERATSRKK